MPDERTELLERAPVGPSTTGDGFQGYWSSDRAYAAWAAFYRVASYCLRYTAYCLSGQLSTVLSILCEVCSLRARKDWVEIPISFEAAVFKAFEAECATPKLLVDALKQVTRANRKATAIPDALQAYLRLINQTIIMVMAF